MATPNGQVALEDLDIDQLTQVKSQLDEELQHLTRAFSSLKEAETKFKNCMQALDEIKSANKDKNVLIPLTSSLYVPGKLKTTETVIVDIGTGYFVEKSVKSTKTLYNTKVLTLKSSIAQLQQQVEKKDNNSMAVVEVLKIKFAQKDAQIKRDKDDEEAGRKA